MPEPVMTTIPEEDNALYMDAMMRGRTGARLAKEAGIEVPMGFSPAQVSPAPLVRPPAQWTNAAQPSSSMVGGSDFDWQMEQMNRSMARIPIDQAAKAISAGMQFQAMRGYQQDIASGKPAAETLAKWAPMLFGQIGRPGSMGGAASMVRATKPAIPTPYEFVAGDTNRPAIFQPTGGGKPVIVPRSAMPQPEISSALQKEEIVPGSGVYAITQPGQRGFKIAVTSTGKLTPAQIEKQQMQIMKDLPKYEESLQYMSPEDPQYSSTTNLIRVLKEKLGNVSAPIASAPVVAPTVTAQTNAPSTNAIPTAAKSPFKEGQQIRNKKTRKLYVIRNGVPVPVEE